MHSWQQCKASQSLLCTQPWLHCHFVSASSLNLPHRKLAASMWVPGAVMSFIGQACSPKLTSLSLNKVNVSVIGAAHPVVTSTKFFQVLQKWQVILPESAWD